MLLRRLQRKVFKGRFHCVLSAACCGERISLTAYGSIWLPNVLNLAFWDFPLLFLGKEAQSIQKQ